MKVAERWMNSFDVYEWWPKEESLLNIRIKTCQRSYIFRQIWMTKEH